MSHQPSAIRHINALEILALNGFFFSFVFSSFCASEVSRYISYIMGANSPFADGQAKWIWVPGYDDTTEKGQFVTFRRTFEIREEPTEDVLLHVSADTRYRLYLNGESISFGPCKSYLSRWNYETVHIGHLLKTGANVFAAKVLRFSAAHDGCLSMVRSPLPGFIIDCQCAVS
jgi:hypothetical protein